MKLSQIIDVCAPAIRSEMVGNHEFCHPILRQAYREGKITLQALGPTLTVGGVDYPVEELRVPMIWDVDGDVWPERRQIEFVKNLLVDAIDEHDRYLCELLKDHDLIISQHYHYDYGTTHRFNNKKFVKNLYTAYFKIPREKLG